MSLAPGSKLGPYEVVALIGAGGMGEVYRAKDARLGRDVAVKVLPASFSADADRLRRFEQEARAAGILNHPNITAVYDIGSHDGAPYVVQELLEGETLRAVLSGGRLSARKAIEYAQQIAQGLAAAHEKGIVHRDLKPENLFVTKDARVKILDFGLAKLTHTEEGGGQQTNMPTATAGTEPGVVMGTLGYMSPEQVRGRSADVRSDLFSFGAILYEMLSGKRAFHGDSAADTMSSILREDPPDLSVTNQSISPGLERIVRHCLEKNPDMRFQSARDLAFDLESLTGISGAAVPQAVSGPRARRSPWLAVGLAAAAAVGLAFWAGRRGGMTAAEGASRTRAVTNQRVTYRRGNLLSARFAPDGQSVVYGGAWDDRPVELFVSRVGNPEARPLGTPGANILAVSPSGELAIQLKKHNLFDPSSGGTLARMPLDGGAPREVLEDVLYADFGPDGKSLAVGRRVDGRVVLEYPIGKRIYDQPGAFGSLRLSPSGDRLALLVPEGDLGAVALLDLAGKKTVLTKGFVEIESPIWHPSGKELWFSASDGRAGRTIYAVTLGGSLRAVSPGVDLILHDISRDGRLLVERGVGRAGILFHGPKDSGERELSWLGGADPAKWSPEANAILFSETGETGGEKGSVYIRKTDGSPAIRLGEGHGTDLSPDGKWALATVPSGSGNQLVMLPTGAGQAQIIPTGNLYTFGAGFLPDGKRIVIGGRMPEHRAAAFLLELPNGKLKQFVPEGPLNGGAAISPDGRSMAVQDTATRIAHAYPVEGGERRQVATLEPGEVILQWSADGRSLYVGKTGEIPMKIFRLEMSTGKRELWRELGPADRAGVISLGTVSIAPDGQSYAYGYTRILASDLFVIDGLK